METIRSATNMQRRMQEHLKQRHTIGFVPTMGALHEGHLALIRRAQTENDITVVSIFVNPLQFAPHEDFNRYPREHDQDTHTLTTTHVDYAFIPPQEEMYPQGYQSFIQVRELSKKLCGVSRPHFFEGVATICVKLFHITQATRAYFGQKDYQQARIITQLCQDLSIPTSICVVPIVRDEDGLALSSRNRYLSPPERAEALYLHKSLEQAKQSILGGEKDAQTIRDGILKTLAQSRLLRIDYLSICDAESLEELTEIKHGTLIALAAYIGGTRLIDNYIYDST